MGMRINGLGHGPLADRRQLGEQRRQRDEAPADGSPRQEHDRVETRHGQSEQLRAEFAAINGAIREAEEALALITLAREGLRRVSAELAGMGEVLRPWAPDGDAPARGEVPPADVRERLAAALEAIGTVAETTCFGSRRLLDGSLGCQGHALGDGLAFVGAGAATRNSPPQGYEVVLTQEPIRATLLGARPLSDRMIADGAQLVLREGDAGVRVTTRAGQTPAEVAALLQAEATGAGLALSVEATRDGRLVIQHRLFGAAHRFAAGSSVPGVLSTPEGGMRLVANGKDIAGTLNGEPAEGRGETLTGCAGNTTTDGLTIRYTGLPFTGATGGVRHRRQSVFDHSVFVGRVVVAQQALPLRLDASPQAVTYLRLDSVHPAHLARAVPNPSGFGALGEVMAEDPARARDAARLVTAAADEVREQDARLAELVDGTLTGLLTRLRVQAQNLAAVTQDLIAPGAAVLAVQALSRHILADGRVALTAQAHPPKGALLELLDDARGETPPGGSGRWN